MTRAIVVKLGGSIISDKRVDLSYRGDVVTSLARAISDSGERVVLVHGGGSFGHPLARKYGLSSSRTSASASGVSETRQAMFDLDARICASLISGGLHPYPFSPFPLLTAAGRRGLVWLGELLDSGLTPVTFGDVVAVKGGFTIISGDTMCERLCEWMKTRCIFVMDVEGILDASGRVIPVLDESSASALGASTSTDATGGIARKVGEAMKMASGGSEVAFVSGYRLADFSKALKRQSFHGTIAKVPSRD